ncbi:hypothetical protein ABR737_43565 [Streptomyces sp. Edi2]|uniref:hypothetical protein n=1 Tax=Streptomyces sp. Edi2 TaxID=3162528 RepID=UPI003305705D
MVARRSRLDADNPVQWEAEALDPAGLRPLVAVAPYVGNAVFAARLAEESGARARCAGQGVLCVSSTS